MTRVFARICRCLLAGVLVVAGADALAQNNPASATSAAASESPSVDAPAVNAPVVAPTTESTGAGDSLAPFKWLRGCWQGTVNQREFREMWLLPAGGTMVGLGHTVMQGKTVDVEFMRIEQRPDSSIAYVMVVPGQKESVYKLLLLPGEEQVFVNNSIEFPNRVIYRPGTEGWMYARVEGKVNGQAKQVIYPMRRIDCVSGEFALK